MNQTSVLLFDIGNVLIGWNQSRLLDRVFETTSLEDTPNTRKLFAEWNDRWDAGSMRDLCEHEIAQHPDLEPAIRAYCDFWALSLDPVLEDVFDIVEDAKKAGYSLYTASNFAMDNFELTKPRMPRLALFDGLHISGERGLCKPDTAFFEDMMQRFGFKAENALFIDDRPANIAGAQKTGIQSHLFATAPALRSYLQDINLL
jgi:2-haloacid dehalogenase